jgi:hypothetical protein
MKLTIYLDFDGTVVEHQYPALGAENPHAIRVIRALQDKGHTIILNTYRADINDGSLAEALEYLNSPTNGLSPITEHTARKIHPGPFDLRESVRFEKLYIDDIAEEIPLIPNRMIANGFMVDWLAVEQALIQVGIL